MDTYSFLRELADSWVLLALFTFFVGAILFVFRPGARKLQEDAANLPFRHEDAPAPVEAQTAERMDSDTTAPREGGQPRKEKR